MKIQNSKIEEWLDLDFDLINELKIGCLIQQTSINKVQKIVWIFDILHKKIFWNCNNELVDT